jgi:Cu/Ag efflux protein CusF
MKTALVALSLVLSMSSLPAMAADEHGEHGSDHKPDTEAMATHSGSGKVVSVNSAAGTVKLTHDPIKSLKWPKMTMDFKAHDPAMLNDLKPGTQVEFELMKMGGGYHIMKISPSTN